MPKLKLLILIVLMSLAAVSCAKKGSITGGLKDTIAPVIVTSSPKNMSTNFSGKEIRINFSEYIKIKDINKQLIISPPLKNQPNIVPAGSASKFINISIRDTLQPNTTYSFNFGQSITDNNEGNPYSQFKFVFSTGSYIDSLAQTGSIKDAYSIKTDNFVTVMLYEANETFNDSTIYKERPRYVTNTLDSMVNFSLENLKAGKYHLFAVKDVGGNYLYNPKSDKLAFLNKTITVPNDTTYQLKLFKEKGTYKAVKPTQTSSNRLYVGYEGDYKGMKATVKNGTGTEEIKSMLTKVADKDSLQLWLPRELKPDSLKVQISRNDVVQNFVVKFKEMKSKDSLQVDAVQKGGLHFRENFTLTASTPIVSIDTSKITLVNKDSVAVAFTQVYDDMKQQLVFDFPKEESQKYTMTLMPGALTDFYGKENDTLNYKLNTRTYADYANLDVKLLKVKRFPVIVEITDEKGKVYASAYSDKETNLNFDAILPNKYLLRIIYDDNKNREWDTGDYLQKIQPEEVIYYHGPKGKDDVLIDVREMWDVEQELDGGGQ
ncbi:hypothetical protein Q765_07475 [Flavobacterium rivuli WB 3.3-2 = DSM 21788]|uniref:SbsA Ig-like domain-containing protein n=1 Tax=Flavobacterium rivuli WB 3.3-2 = DSM 21788 TaxID=1121895 RepID=A0A0A2M436_9FLAO|nr:Ig-like domain-containing protein [Flavobacterium rivuli]KGO87044.1 hypothetical protein Q765_07475 [Flavobacterium rivuli WB 3.3-2 = DSM 21788]